MSASTEQQPSRVVLVTGASAGIGLATANLLASRGWTVVGASRRGAGGEGWTGLVMDVDSDESVRAGVQAVLGEHGHVGALVACAGWGLAGPVETTTMEEARTQVETNFWGCVRVTAELLPAMRAQGSGRIVLMSSIGGLIAIPFQAYYSASKFALEGWAEATAYEVAPFGVHVTLVEPGNVRTDFTENRRHVLARPGPYDRAVHRAIEVMERDERDGGPTRWTSPAPWPGFSTPSARADGCRWARPASGWGWSPSGCSRTGGSRRPRGAPSAWSRSLSTLFAAKHRP